MLMTAPQSSLLPPEVIVDAAHCAARAIPPLWPLASSVAVNPFLGQTNEPLATASARLRRMAGIALTMPRTWFAERLRSGEITDEDLRNAFEAAPAGLRPPSVDELKRAVQSRRDAPQALPTIGDLARNVTGIDWPRIIDDRIGHWASSYFDQGQALWPYPSAPSAYSAWRIAATHDLVPEINGLTGFAGTVAQGPEKAEDALYEWVSMLEIPEAGLESYFHRLLMSLGGWSQLARYRLWQAELSRDSDTTTIDLLAIRASYDAALLRKCGAKLMTQWQAARATYAQPAVAAMDDSIDAILQEAAERAAQRQLQITLGGSSATSRVKDRPRLQMAFCIDVRSEVFRRALESLSADIQTLGFAGFFGLGIGHRRFGSDVVEARLPVLLSPAVFTCSPATTTALKKRETRKRIAARAKRAWGRFKLAAISSFAFVEAAGPIYVTKLLRDGLALKRPRATDDPAPQPAIDLDRQTKVRTAASVLQAMSLTENFARLVLLAGHGANVVNNPHASALHCGACGGYSGEVNARLLATLLNDADVRAGLAELGISIPQDTLFLAALHDTTTDEVTIYAADHIASSHADDLARAAQWLKSASALARAERSLRLPRAAGTEDIARRSRDWAELRPEWALAGNQAFIAAPRARTAGLDLAGRAFLHEYDWRRDDGFSVLELIMTAPVVVASWINLQYYGSTVAPEVFGAGNKLLHNVTGGIGVIEGNGGLLRSGLPWQSIHDGERLVHEPLRLTVMIEAPRAAITDILDRHPDVRALFDNRWLHLMVLDDDGRMAWRYSGHLAWETCFPLAEKPTPDTTAVQPIG